MKDMNKELEILPAADYYERFAVGEAEGYLIVNKNMKEHQCMFGFVTLPEDLDTARELFSLMENKAKELGYADIVGPLNYTTWLSYRWAVNNYDMKLYPDCDNPPYYVDFIKELGYKELYTYRSAFIDMDNPLYHVGKKVYESKLREGYEFKFYFGKAGYEKVRDIYDISIDAFEGSKLYSPLPFEYFERIYLEWIKQVEAAVYIAYKDGKAVGYVMGYMNPYSHDFISKTSAVLKEYQKHKVYVALLYLGVKYVKDLGLDKMIYHFQCEQRDTFQRFDSRIESREKNYAVYVKELI